MISSNMEQFSEYDPKDIFAYNYPFAEETALEVLDCLDKRNKDGLKKLFQVHIC